MSTESRDKLSIEEKKKLELIRLKRQLQPKLDVCFDPDDLNSQPSPTQLRALADDKHRNIFIVAPNRTGKTAFAARAVSWFFQNKHPFIPNRKKWGTDGFTILVIGRTTTIIETEIWRNKIEKFLEPGTYKTKYNSSGIEHVDHLKTGNRILFLSHHDAKNAREKVQGFTAPIVWLDEMPDDSSLLTELAMRTMTNDGIFMATFTPLVENEQVKKVVETITPYTKKYVFPVEENPRLMDNIEEYESELKARCATEAEYRARRYGEWYYRSGRVVKAFTPELHITPSMPAIYSPQLNRHVVVVDPAASGLVGVSVFAEVPEISKWICVDSRKLEGDAAFILVKKVEEIIARYNISRRICDNNPAGFYKEAARQGIRYDTMFDKADRKNATIEKTNDMIARGGLLFLKDKADALCDEMLQAKWSETDNNRIIHSHSWHLIDTLRYFCERTPAPLPPPREYADRYHRLKQEVTEKEEVALKQAAKEFKRTNKKAPGYRVISRHQSYFKNVRRA